MTTANEAVAAEIRAELARRRLSQTGLAIQLDVSRQWVARRIIGHTAFTIDDIAAIADVLDVPTSQLVHSVDRVRRAPASRARASVRRSDSAAAS